MHHFPRDPASAFDHIAADAVRQSVTRLAGRVPGLERRVREAGTRSLLPLFDGSSGFNVTDALVLGAAAAFLCQAGPDDYDAALVRQGLADRDIAGKS